jgi:formylglycine-generating enzyme required for sulfatase activity
MGETVLRFVHEMTNVEEVRLDFHKLLSEIMMEFKAGNRDPQKEQDIIRFILNFRALSQEWEAKEVDGTFIRDFWQDRLNQEMEAAGEKAKPETMQLNISGGEPIEIVMVQAPAGGFLMGDEVDRPIHRVEITKPFMIATIPVTQILYRAVTGKRPADFQGDDLPVENINWFEAVQFCNDLSKMLNLESAYRIDGEQAAEWDQESLGFRLPTEAKWEYVCRAGATTRFACGDLASDLETMGWYGQNSGHKTHPVKSKPPNTWGIFDMHGNVREWVWDWYGEYPGGVAVDPKGPERGAHRVIRGGSWGSGARLCRSAYRFDYLPGIRDFLVGFRLTRSVALGP